MNSTPNSEAGSASPASKTTAERFEGIRAARLALGKGTRTTVAEMCRELKVSPSGYHSYVRRKARGPSPRDVADLRDFSLVKAVYEYREMRLPS